ncbi:NAD(P)H oxidoreductase [Actinosynnema sp. CS-041913]|uniref:NAD(P)H oxidoreductase n=1 Tax=Actinosynnema sp. CS-041913 TaxID=3239917 RepID=UPI003D89EF6F
MRALLVVAHHRKDSLTAHLAARARARLEAGGVEVDLLDLHAEGFDPRMSSEDEPDWADAGKVYSPEVRAHMARIVAADLVTVVFPVWWFGPPAILKGWIDRVWNHGFAYGPSVVGGKRMRWLGLAGESASSYEERGVADVLDRQLRVGVSEFCGITDAALTVLHGTVTRDPERVAGLVARAGDAVEEWLRR